MSRIVASELVQRICPICYSINFYLNRKNINGYRIISAPQVHIHASQGLIWSLAVLGESVCPDARRSCAWSLS